MSSIVKPKIVIKKADGALVKGTILKGGSDDDHVAKATAASDKVFLVAQNDASAAEDLVECAAPGGGAKFLAGGTIAAGDSLTADSNGKAVASTTAADQIIGIAEVSAVSGDLFAGFVMPSVNGAA